LGNSLSIISGIDLNDIEKKLIENTEEVKIDYFLDETFSYNNEKKYFFFIKTNGYKSKNAIIEDLSNWIIDVYTNKVLKKILITEFMLDTKEREKILKSAIQKTGFLKKNYYKKQLVKKLTNYFKTEDNLIIDGFLRFRFFEYNDELYRILYETIDEFYVEKEYEEFINLLKLYIDEKPPMIDLLHVKQESNGNFAFYDFKKNNISINIEKSEEINLIENFLTKEDILLSILMTLAPKRIIWHSKCKSENKTIINTISEIFKERFTVCCGCELCDN